MAKLNQIKVDTIEISRAEVPLMFDRQKGKLFVKIAGGTVEGNTLEEIKKLAGDIIGMRTEQAAEARGLIRRPYLEFYRHEGAAHEIAVVWFLVNTMNDQPVRYQRSLITAPPSFEALGGGGRPFPDVTPHKIINKETIRVTGPVNSNSYPIARCNLVMYPYSDEKFIDLMAECDFDRHVRRHMTDEEGGGFIDSMAGVVRTILPIRPELLTILKGFMAYSLDYWKERSRVWRPGDNSGMEPGVFDNHVTDLRHPRHIRI